MKLSFFLLVFLSTALAAPRLGGTAEILFNRQGQTLNLSVHTDPLKSKHHEMSFYLFQRDDDSRSFIRRIVPPTKPGLYILDYTFPQKGSWGMSLRYGVGLDRYETWMDFQVDDQTQSFTRLHTFQGDLDTKTPRYIQRIGFTIFGLLLLTTLLLTTRILQFIKRQKTLAT